MIGFGFLATALDAEDQLQKAKKPYHYHKDERGIFVRCYHVCKKKAPPIGWWIFFTTISFPIEHALWEMTPLHYITGWFGIH